MRGAVKKTKYIFTASEPYKSRLGNLQRLLLLGRRAKRPCCWGFWGLPAHSLARSPPAGSGFPLSASLAFGLCLLIACLVPLIAAGEGGKPLYWCYRGPGESVVSVQVGLAYILKRCLLAPHLLLYAELKPFHLFGGHHLGSVDCWLCQIFTRSLGTILPSFRVLRVTRRGFSPPESYMQRKC